MVLSLMDPEDIGFGGPRLAVGVAAALGVAAVSRPRLSCRHREIVQPIKENRPGCESHGVNILYCSPESRGHGGCRLRLCRSAKPQAAGHCTFGVVSSMTPRRGVLA